MACSVVPLLWCIHCTLLHRSLHTFSHQEGSSSNQVTPVSHCGLGDWQSVCHGVQPLIAAGYPCCLACRSGSLIARLPLCSRRNLTQSLTIHPLWLPGSFRPSCMPP